jgi:hypothetical protein
MKASKVTIFGNHLVDFSVKLEFSYFVLGFFFNYVVSIYSG